jgi:hypothetical protein
VNRGAHLVELLLPLRDNAGTPYPRAFFDRLRDELIARFGGVTAHLRAPAQGAWRAEPGDPDSVDQDDVVIVEVMVDALDRDWWRQRREALEREWRQQEIVVRVHPIERL